MNKNMQRPSEEKLVRIKVLTHTGDKIHVKLPIDFVKKMVKNNALDFFKDSNDIIDSNKLFNLVMNAFDYNLTGEVAHLERSNGDIIKILIS